MPQAAAEATWRPLCARVCLFPPPVLSLISLLCSGALSLARFSSTVCGIFCGEARQFARDFFRFLLRYVHAVFCFLVFDLSHIVFVLRVESSMTAWQRIVYYAYCISMYVVYMWRS